MRAVLQRVLMSRVEIAGEITAEIGRGLMILLGVQAGDSPAEARQLAEKIAYLRIFEDPDEKMNLSIIDTGGEALVVPNFTLLADARKGRRPSFVEAARPEAAIPLYEGFVHDLETLGVSRVATGVFGADMLVTIANDGPVTILLDTSELVR